MDLKNLSNVLQNLNEQIQTIDNLANKPSIIKKTVGKKYLPILNQISINLPDFIKVLNNFANKDQKVIIVFQNSDEIRATGGFMGSYAVVNIVNGTGYFR